MQFFCFTIGIIADTHLPGMEFYLLIGSLMILLMGALYLKRLWLGAALGMIVFLSGKYFLGIKQESLYKTVINSSIISAELLLLLFGAYFFYQLLKRNNHFDTLNKVTASLSSRLIVIIMLCYFLGSFMEGIAGFGIPAMLIAPMLLSMKFKPLTCVVLPLAANTCAVTFGALGTPLKIGLGIQESEEVVKTILLLNIIPAVSLPFCLALIYAKLEQVKINWRNSTKMLLGSGLIFATIYCMTGWYSIDFVSVYAGLFGLIIFVTLFVSGKERPPVKFWLNTFYPYFGLVMMLLIARHFLGNLSWNSGEGIKSITFYQPGLIFILTGWLYHQFFADKKQALLQLNEVFKSTTNALTKPAITILLLVGYAQLIREDLTLLAQNQLSFMSHSLKIVLHPLMGVSGSFLSGSATMSNLIFGDAIRSVSNTAGHSSLLIALLHTGSAIGNAISLQNILMVKSVLEQNVLNYFDVIKHNIMVVGVYTTIIILICLLI